ncbi:hypothetical protein [Gryllotalpicola protaetiae]|nr:hypothetical protein [Gryllotalpicola protaetiae]
MHQAELAWHRELAGTTIGQLTENATPASAERAARWLRPDARVGLSAQG